jgi:hypothetical protein
MAEPAAVSHTTSPSPRKVRTALPAWSQQRGENDLWYFRFLRFVALGPGRSVSLVSTGERNHYPVPAHWPIQAKQLNWRERAKIFDEAAKEDPALITTFNGLLESFAVPASEQEKKHLKGLMRYMAPEIDEDYEDSVSAQTT